MCAFIRNPLFGRSVFFLCTHSKIVLLPETVIKYTRQSPIATITQYTSRMPMVFGVPDGERTVVRVESGVPGSPGE